MDFLIDPAFWGRWIRIVILDICLAEDNALVIALAVRTLLAQQQFWGMSLDNVLAISGAAQGDMKLVIFGLLLSIPLVVWGSGLLAKLTQKHRWIIWLGSGVLGFVAIEMILKDEIVVGWAGVAMAHRLYPILPWVLGVGLTILGWVLARGAVDASGGTEKIC